MDALRIGAHAYRFLTARPRSGRIVSSFRHGVNVLFDNMGPPGLISVQTVDVPLHPWAVETPGLVATRSASSVVARDGVLRFAGVSVDLLKARICPLGIKSYTKEEAEHALTCWPRIAETLERERPQDSSDPFEPQIGAILAAWQETGNIEILLELIGLGTGSTPSGDDVLVGLLAGLVAQKEISALAAETLMGLSESILDGQKLLTPHGSAQSLQAATENGFLEPLPALARALARNDADPAILRTRLHALAGLGSLSGRSLIRGFAAGLQIDRSSENTLGPE